MNRRYFFLGGLAALAGCSRGAAPAARPRIVAATPPYVTTFPIYVAQEAGYFEAAGLDVELREEPSSPATTALLAGGEVDVSFNAFHPSHINLIARGAKIRFVAGREVATPDCSETMVLYGSVKTFPNGLSDLRQLAGKRFSVTRQGNLGEFSADSILATVGLSTADMSVSYLREADAAAALIGGHLDAMIGSQSQHELGEFQDRVVRGPGLADVLPGFQYSFALFGQKMLEGDPEIGVAFLLAYLQGARDYLQGVGGRYIDAFAAAHHLDPESIRTACRESFEPTGRLYEDSFDTFVAWGIRKGYCDADAAGIQPFETRYIDEAARRLAAAS
jgi:NitT/TauT family transport system substrate-binding protein